MSTQFYSDEDTVDRYNQPTLEHLINQNKMKDLALSKASNLIELLNIELEVERNSSQETIKQMELELRHKYESEMHKLKERVEILQRQLNRTASASNSTEKTMRHSAFVRANSLRSLENRRKRSINIKYTEHQTIQSNDNKSETAPFISVQNEYFKQQMLIIQEWKTEVIEELDRVVQSEYNELSDLINTIQACSDDFEELIAESPKKRRSPLEEMGRIIKEQQGLINSLRAYTQDLQDMNKNILFKIQSLGAQNASHQMNTEELHVQRIASQIKRILGKRREQWSEEISGLQTENGELKSILDSMIKLVKEEKKIRT